MKVIGVIGSGSGALAERLVARLDGRVAAVTESGDAPAPGDARVDGTGVTYHVADAGWTAAGDDRSLDEVLDRLAPEYDYAVVDGFAGADLSRVVLGDVEHEGSALVEATDPDAVDLDEVVEAVDGLEAHVTLEALVREAKRSPDAERAGAIATFTGRVRAKDAPDDAPTRYLEFEKYEGVAEERMAAIARELGEREGVYEVLVHHRTGVIEYGEDIVFVVVLAGHRDEAFRTVEDGINRLKEEVPIFKKEATTDEQFWVHERA